MHDIPRIVLTGGPCAGKTHALHILRKRLPVLGIAVITVPESASELITAGCAPNNSMLSTDEFQRLLFTFQKAKEDYFIEMVAPALHASRKVLIFDRGLMDTLAYTTPETFTEISAAHALARESILARYDAVLHLQTAAIGALEYYSCESNPARIEKTFEEAVASEQRTIAAWKGHPRRIIFDNSTDFEGKIARICDEVRAILGIQTLETGILFE